MVSADCRKPRRNTSRPLCLDVEDDDDAGMATWSVDFDGNMRHRATGTTLSTQRGITFEGHEYQLSPDDLEIAGPILGSGAGGFVQKGVIKRGGSEVAIKTIRMDDKKKRDQLLNEIRSLVQAEGCPFLVQWYAGFVSAKTHAVHMVLELMDLGSLGDLKKRLRGQGIPVSHLSCMSMQMVLGLQHLHSRKILHRDVKPQNILLNSLGEVKLTDFGIAKLLEENIAVACSVVGTQIYMSPERCKGEEYTLVSDIWSVGVVVYEMATGRYPFPDTTSFIALFDCLCQKPEPRLDVSLFPPALCNFVELCLTRDVAQRPGCEVLILHPFVTLSVESQDELAIWLATLA